MVFGNLFVAFSAFQYLPNFFKWNPWKYQRENFLHRVVATRFAKRKINVCMMMAVSEIVQLHIITLLCWMFHTGYFRLDFFVEILISICITVRSDLTYTLVQNNLQDSCYTLVRYAINNYSVQRFQYWRRFLIFGSCCYFLALLSVVDINREWLQICIVQYLCIFVVVDWWKNRKIHRFIQAMYTRGKQITYRRIHITDEYCMIESRMDPSSYSSQPSALSSMKEMFPVADETGQLLLLPNINENKNKMLDCEKEKKEEDKKKDNKEDTEPILVSSDAEYEWIQKEDTRIEFMMCG